MPVIVAFFARQLVIIGVQLGIFSLIDRFVTPLLNNAISGIVSALGVNRSTAQDILANEVITTAESLGLTVALSKARLPLALADTLGFTTKGFTKRKLTSGTEAALNRAKASGVRGTVPVVVPSAAEAASIVNNARSVLPGFAKAYALTIGTLSTVFLGFMVVGNWIDFGNWNSGAYQKTFQRILAAVTGGLLVPDADYRKTKTVSPEVFDKVYNTYKNNGAVAINDPFKNATVIFSRDALIDLLDQVGAKLLLATGSASTKDVITASQLMISFPVDAPLGASPPVSGPSAPAPAAVPQVKVFTGLVSQGKLGNSVSFTPRPDDLIVSVDDLKIAATNNLAAALAALPSRLVYEIKVVPSVVTRDGFTQRGQSQQVVSGSYADGRPRYRTVVNKFAVLTVYLLTERGTRTKVQQIVLGPTDVVRFNPTATELSLAEGSIKSSLTTSDVSEIKQVAGSAPLVSAEVVPDVNQPAPTPEEPFPQIERPSGDRIPDASSRNRYFDVTHTRDIQRDTPGHYVLTWFAYYNITSSRDQWDYLRRLGVVSGIYDDKAPGDPVHTALQALNRDRALAQRVLVTLNLGTEDNKAALRAIFTVPGSKRGRMPTPKLISTASAGVCAATTLYELAVAQGVSLPTVAERAPEYEALGLGPASFYTGTAEQNTKLLAALKAKLGCVRP